jgi:hypothetical protein
VSLLLKTERNGTTTLLEWQVTKSGKQKLYKTYQHTELHSVAKQKALIWTITAVITSTFTKA